MSVQVEMSRAHPQSCRPRRRSALEGTLQTELPAVIRAAAAFRRNLREELLDAEAEDVAAVQAALSGIDLAIENLARVAWAT